MYVPMFIVKLMEVILVCFGLLESKAKVAAALPHADSARAVGVRADGHHAGDSQLQGRQAKEGETHSS